MSTVLFNSLMRGINTAFFRPSISPSSKDKLTISSQYGANVSIHEERSEAGNGSYGEHLTPYDLAIFMISSRVAGSNSDIFESIGFVE